MNDDAALFLALSGQLGGGGGRGPPGGVDDDRGRLGGNNNDEDAIKPPASAMSMLTNGGEYDQERDDDDVTNANLRSRLNGMLQGDFCEAAMPGNDGGVGPQSSFPGAGGNSLFPGASFQGGSFPGGTLFPAAATQSNYNQQGSMPNMNMSNMWQNYLDYSKPPPTASSGNGANDDNNYDFQQHHQKQQQKQQQKQAAIEEGTTGNQVPPFPISDIRRKNANGASLCLAAGCEKNAQANTRINDSSGFCRVHFNAWLISSGQIASWDCECGNKVPVDKRCGKCHRWREKPPQGGVAHSNKPAATVEGLTKKGGNKSKATAHANLPGEKARPQCKVDGCKKMEQAKCQGFCRMHYNMFEVVDGSGDWTCVCGQLMPSKQKRCGKCNKWKGGKRAPYTMNAKKKEKRVKVVSRVSNHGSNDPDTGENWMCKCGNEVPATKSRCGRCHHWKGGKRKGGWKIKMSAAAEDDHGIEWGQDWSCCGETIPAAKKRCGSCHGWRGGKRVAAKKAKTSHGTTSMTTATIKREAPQEDSDSRPTWECTNCKTSNPAAKRKCVGCREWKKNSAAVKSPPALASSEERASAGATMASLSTLVRREDDSSSEQTSEGADQGGYGAPSDGLGGSDNALNAFLRSGGNMGHAGGASGGDNALNALLRSGGNAGQFGGSGGGDNALNALLRSGGNFDNGAGSGGSDNALNALLRSSGGNVGHNSANGGGNALNALLQRGGNFDNGGYGDTGNTMSALYGQQGGNMDRAGLLDGYGDSSNAMSALYGGQGGGNAQHAGLHAQHAGLHGGYGDSGNAMSALYGRGGGNAGNSGGAAGGYGDDNALSALVRMGMASLGTLGGNGGYNGNGGRAGGNGGRGDGNSEHSGADGGRGDGNLEHAAFV